MNKLFPPIDADNRIYYITIASLAFVTLVILLILIPGIACILTFAATAAASFCGGAAIGFLFGLPRAEKYRFLKKDDADHNAREYEYGDNTNLEEVSDWLTKIIVGLTLIKLNVILGWLHTSANSIKSVCRSCGEGEAVMNSYVFGYATIIFYFLAGAGLFYLWARTNLSVILTRSRRAQRATDRAQATNVQQTLNPNLQSPDGLSTVATPANLNTSMSADTDLTTGAPKSLVPAPFPTEEFRKAILTLYNSKRVSDKFDLQRGRWGGKAERNNYVLEATYLESTAPRVFRLKLSVRFLKMEENNSELAFFLHDTFPSEIVFSKMSENRADLVISAYEAFVTGARLADGTELELDLNKVPGFPKDFYWK